MEATSGLCEHAEEEVIDRWTVEETEHTAYRCLSCGRVEVKIEPAFHIPTVQVLA